jgi:hypothetical protein
MNNRHNPITITILSATFNNEGMTMTNMAPKLLKGTFAYVYGPRSKWPGHKYIGEFSKNRWHGRGTLVYPGGEKYIGEFRNGKRNGHGTHIFANGEEYTGSWKNDKSHGQGTYTYADGDEYVGEWKDNKKHGHGTFTHPGEGEYVGEFRDGKKNGQGTWTYPGGSKYVGGFRDGKRNGQGTHIWADGTPDKGLWKNNKLVELATVKKSNVRSINMNNSDQAVVTGAYSDFKLVKTRSVVQMIVEIPIEYGEKVTRMFGLPQPGAEVPVVVARLDAQHTTAQKPQEARAERWDESALSKQAAIRCNEVDFWHYLEGLVTTGGQSETIRSPAEAAGLVRSLTRVASRREFNLDSEAGERWKTLDLGYQQATGRAATP